MNLFRCGQDILVGNLVTKICHFESSAVTLQSRIDVPSQQSIFHEISTQHFLIPDTIKKLCVFVYMSDLNRVLHIMHITRLGEVSEISRKVDIC